MSFFRVKNYTDEIFRALAGEVIAPPIDEDETVALVLNHYERFDSQYKGLIPLKRVYLPDSRRGVRHSPIREA